MMEQEEMTGSIVSDTTIDSDQTIRTPKMFHGLKALKDQRADVSFCRYPEIEMSPVIPITQTTSAPLQKISLKEEVGVLSEDASQSDMSEILIPLVSRVVTPDSGSIQHLHQHSSAPTDSETEASQSLFLQLDPGKECLPLMSTIHPAASSSDVSLSQQLLRTSPTCTSSVSTSADRQSKHSGPECSSGSRSLGFQEESVSQSRCIQTLQRQTTQKHPEQPLTDRDQNHAQSVIGCEDKVNQHPKQREITLPGSQSQSGEIITMSQVSGVTGLATSDGMDATDKLSARLNRLVSALKSASHKQVQVIEVTILHSISRLQDILNNKLKQPQAQIKSSLGVVKKLVEATGQNLSQYVEHQRRQKDRPAEPSSGMATNDRGRQRQSVLDASQQKRQVYNLLKRQKLLMECLKTTYRPKKLKSSKQHKTETARESLAGSFGFMLFALGSYHKVYVPSMLYKVKHISRTSSTPLSRFDSPGATVKSQIVQSKVTHEDEQPLRASFPQKVTGSENNNLISIDTNMTNVQKATTGDVNRKANTSKAEENLKGRENIPLKSFIQEGRNIVNESERMKTSEEGLGTGSVTCSNRGSDLAEPDDLVEASGEITAIPDTQELFTDSSVHEAPPTDPRHETALPFEDSLTISGDTITESQTNVMTTSKASAMKSAASEDIPKSMGKSSAIKTAVFEDKPTPAVKRSAWESEGFPSSNKLRRIAQDNSDANGTANDVDKETVKQQNQVSTSEHLWLKMLNNSVNVDANCNTKPIRETSKQNMNKNNTNQCKVDGTKKKYWEEVLENVPKIQQSNSPQSNGIKTAGESFKHSDTSCKFKSDNFEMSPLTRPTTSSAENPEVEKTREGRNMSKDLPDTVTKLPDVGLMSPPSHRVQGEVWENVSPTATSMSSDVFVVKTKELQRRMQQRMSQGQSQQAMDCEEMTHQRVDPGRSVAILDKQQRPDSWENQMRKSEVCGVSVNNANKRMNPNMYGIVSAQTDITLRGLNHQQKIGISEKHQGRTEKNVKMGSEYAADVDIYATGQETNAYMQNEVRKVRKEVSEKIDSLIQSSNKVNRGQSKISSNFNAKIPGSKSKEQNKNRDCNVKFDSVTSVIESVVDQAREMADKQIDAHGATKSGSSFVRPKPVSSTAREQSLVETPMRPETFGKIKTHVLPSLGDLISQGKIHPGRDVLSVTLQNKLHVASLTDRGKIQTSDGHVFPTVSRWVTPLIGGHQQMKKIKSYKMVQYKGQALISICGRADNAGVKMGNPDNCFDALDDTVESSKLDKAIQTDLFDATSQTSLPSTAAGAVASAVRDRETAGSREKDDSWTHLKEVFTGCRIRLLQESDFVSAEDLPDNFWDDNLSAESIPEHIWTAVTAW